ncbi:gliding motility-associated C-terminal domain-containing protein, partial [Gillisia marina]|uniref:gliding motility-associated C-terminal domain-containing protein n=1 Tax=Gillisia marina TaxID=1167637 RepID=UPI000299F1A0
EEAEAGKPVVASFCVTETQDVQLTSLLGDGINTLGDFDAPFEDGIFNPATAGVGTFEFDYTLDGADDCVTGTSTTTFTITVRDIEEANAGAPVVASFCITEAQDVQLTSLLSDGINTLGDFDAPFENGIFNPATAGVGVFEFDYTLDGADDCVTGTSTTTFTITVTDLPDAPTADANQSFCLIDNPTAADLVATGDNVIIYSDAELTTVVDATTALTDGAIFYAVANNDEATCSSDATTITVSLTDPAAPTLSTDGDEFCRSDNPTVQDLINNFTGSGVLIYTSSTGGSPLAATTALENGVTYYGASLDGTTGCESTERIAVVAKVEFCGIPEGFSPNGDGINDRFVIPDIAENFPNYSIEIFNRWGNVVFKGNANTGDWDGISNQSGTLGDDVLPVGVYFYILNYNDGQTSPVQGKLYLSI